MPFKTQEWDDETLATLSTFMQGGAPEQLPRWYIDEGLVTAGLTNRGDLRSDALVGACLTLTHKGMRIVEHAYKSGRLVYVPWSQR